MTVRYDPARMHVLHGVYYFASYELARDYASARGWAIDRILFYTAGWAIQKTVSGPYYGPEDER